MKQWKSCLFIYLLKNYATNNIVISVTKTGLDWTRFIAFDTRTLQYTSFMFPVRKHNTEHLWVFPEFTVSQQQSENLTSDLSCTISSLPGHAPPPSITEVLANILFPSPSNISESHGFSDCERVKYLGEAYHNLKWVWRVRA
jgi:hypothetical protein